MESEKEDIDVTVGTHLQVLWGHSLRPAVVTQIFKGVASRSTRYMVHLDSGATMSTSIHQLFPNC